MADILEFDDKAVLRAVAVLTSGGLVAIPTETVYGLAADAAHGEGVAGIFAAKGRPQF
ncbi:MAG: Sua5/YciO/YrdC/YwlC family protein, partial [Brucella pseudogrignonensis]